jgi:riboflavin synthase
VFTGLVEEIGTIESVQTSGEGANIRILGAIVASELAIGDSVSVNGACLTVVARDGTLFTVQAVSETLQRTTLSALKPKDRVNLERALTPSSRLGGHFVQGHVDCIAPISKIETKDPGFWLTILLEEPWSKMCVEKGSIAIDGVSLTIARVSGQTIAMALIPHTASWTTLGERKENDIVNVEIDILGKYVYNFTHGNQNKSSLSIDRLNDWGY